MGHACYRPLYHPKLSTPIMHFIGELDTYIPGSLTLKLAQRCLNYRVVYFPGGHYIPRLRWTTDAAAGFICACLGAEEEGGEWEWIEGEDHGDRDDEDE